MKALKPSMRERKRYLLIRGKDLKESVPKAIKEFIGTLGIAKASPKFIKVGKDTLVISINRKSLEYVKASIALQPGKMVLERVSGTLKGLKKK